MCRLPRPVLGVGEGAPSTQLSGHPGPWSGLTPHSRLFRVQGAARSWHSGSTKSLGGQARPGPNEQGVPRGVVRNRVTAVGRSPPSALGRAGLHNSYLCCGHHVASLPRVYF